MRLTCSLSLSFSNRREPFPLPTLRPLPRLRGSDVDDYRRVPLWIDTVLHRRPEFASLAKPIALHDGREALENKFDLWEKLYDALSARPVPRPPQRSLRQNARRPRILAQDGTLRSAGLAEALQPPVPLIGRREESVSRHLPRGYVGRSLHPSLSRLVEFATDDSPCRGANEEGLEPADLSHLH